MSGNEEDETLKGGHPPAMKVGGKRIVQHTSKNEKSEQMTEEDIQEFGSPPKVDTHHQSVFLSGVVMKGDQEFTTQALKFHDKPAPMHDKRPVPQHMHNIQQPRK